MPTIPIIIREHTDCSGWVNVYSIKSCCDEPRLFGTESLYGAWNGSLLLLAKEFYCQDWVENPDTARLSRPYSHNPVAPTNTKIVKHIERLGLQEKTLYGSAAANLLRPGNNKRGGDLPKSVVKYGSYVLRWVVSEMANVRVIATLGGDAEKVCLGASDHKDALVNADVVGMVQKCKLRCLVISGKRLWVVSMWHPQSSQTNKDAEKSWNVVGKCEKIPPGESRGEQRLQVGQLF